MNIFKWAGILKVFFFSIWCGGGGGGRTFIFFVLFVVDWPFLVIDYNVFAGTSLLNATIFLCVSKVVSRRDKKQNKKTGQGKMEPYR